jgi:hypothetical protein
MLLYLELCVDLKEHRGAKDGLHQYRNMSQQHVRREGREGGRNTRRVSSYNRNYLHISSLPPSLSLLHRAKTP